MPPSSKRRSSHLSEETPVLGWASGHIHVPAQQSYATSTAVAPFQYGPLTAQDDYPSNINWPQSLPLATDMAEHLDPGNHYATEANDNGLVTDTWLNHTDVPALHGSGHYDLYGQMLSSQYPDRDLPQGPIVDAAVLATHNLSDGAMSQNTYSPYDGIWAFNPLAVDDNFVYPEVIPHLSDNKTSMPHVAASSLPPKSVEVTASMSNDLAASYAATTSIISDTFPASMPVPIQTQCTPLSAPGGAKRKPFAVSAKNLKPERTRKHRGADSQAVVPRRSGPLSTAQRQKADDMRYYGACWRCRRYKKPCNGPGTCDTCLTSGFRVWPSTIGCYRGNMEDFISGVMPGNAEQVIDGMTFGFNKVPNWKTLFGFRPDTSPIEFSDKTQDKYDALSIKLRATRMAGRGFIELLKILADYQRSRTKPDTCLELACSALNHICDIYHAFVETDTPIHLDASELLNALTKFRAAYNDNWRHFLQLCLSGRRSAWFPAFLCACINVPLLVVLKDGFTAIPEPARSTLWPNISFLIEDLLNRLYPMGLDLLGALAKGIKPWKLNCWGWKEHMEADGLMSLVRDPDGLRLLAGDEGAFDGFGAVQAWLARNRVDMLDGVSFLTTAPFTERNAKMQPIAALAWIFDVNPPKEQE